MGFPSFLAGLPIDPAAIEKMKKMLGKDYPGTPPFIETVGGTQPVQPGSPDELGAIGDASRSQLQYIPSAATQKQAPWQPVAANIPQQPQTPANRMLRDGTDPFDLTGVEPSSSTSVGPGGQIVENDPTAPNRFQQLQASPGYTGATAAAAAQPSNLNPAAQKMLRSSADIFGDITDVNNQIDLTGQGKDGGPREHSALKRFGKGLVRGYKNWDGQGGLLGLGFATLGTGIGGAASPQADRVGELKDKRRTLLRDYGATAADEKMQLDLTGKQMAIDNIKHDNDLADRESVRKENDRIARTQTARMVQVAGMFKNLPSFDPTNPKFKEMTEALGDVKLPITPKDVKKKIDLKQDQRNGNWTTIVTDPLTGEQEVRPVMKDGKQFATTPTVVMQGENALGRQNDQQDFTAGQNNINRVEAMKKYITTSKTNRAKFVAELNQKVSAKKLGQAGMTQAEADAALADFDAALKEIQ